MGPKSLCLCCLLYVIICLTSCGSSTPLLNGKVSSTANVRVAQYSVSSRIAGNVSVEFGLDTKYGLTTWAQPVPQGGTVDILVAGMKANTTYHMRAVMKFS